MNRVYGSSTLYGPKPTKSKEDRTISVTFGRADGDRHCAGIQALAFHNGALYSASRDGTVKRWGIKEDHTPVLEGNYEGHSDWVNAIAFVEDYLASASCDGTVRLWSPTKKESSLIIKAHQDYVSCLASAPGQPYLTSAGLRAEIFLHNIEVDLPVTRKMFPTTDSGDKGSVYSLTMDRFGKMIAAGSTDAVIRLFDIRTGTKAMKLKGHTDNVRCLALSADGTKLLSGSSDHSMKLWDLGHQRCIQTFHVHSDSVWSLLATEDDLNVVISGGRDKCIFKTCLSQRTSELLFIEDAPIHDIVKSQNDGALWVATDSSSIKKRSLVGKLSGDKSDWMPTSDTSNRTVPGRAFLIAGSNSRRNLEPIKNLEPSQEPPAVVIEGIPPIVESTVLNDQCRILTKDKSGHVSLWDVTTGCEIDQFGKIDFQKKLEELHQFISVPRWFSIDKRLGQLTLVLKYPQCFEAEFYAIDFGLDAMEDRRMSFGLCMLKGLLGQWVLELGTGIFEDCDPVDVWGAAWTDQRKNKIPSFRFWDDPRGRISLSGISKSKNPWRVPLAAISGMFNEHNELPDWVVDTVLRGKILDIKEIKLSFHLVPADKSVPQLSQSRLNAPRILQVRKIATYLKQKLLDLDPPFPANIVPCEMDSFESHADSEDTSSLPEDMDIDVPDLELLCKGMAVPFWMSINTVCEYIWKDSKDLYIHYRVRSSVPAPLPSLVPIKSSD
eukprot:g8833.t1